MNQFNTDDRVRVVGERNKLYVVHRDVPAPDGSLLLYGGSANHWKFRSVHPDRLRLVPIKRRRKVNEAEEG